MLFLAAVIAKDIRRHLRDPGTLLQWTGIPLVGGLLLGYVLAGAGGPVAPLLVADTDGSAVSRAFVEELPGRIGSWTIRVDRTSEAAGHASIRTGRASALLVVPEGFGSAVVTGRPITLRLVTNPTQSILPRILEEALRTRVEALGAGQRQLGARVLTMLDGPRPSEEPLQRGPSTYGRDAYARLLELTDGHDRPTVREAPAPSGSVEQTVLYLVPGLLLMSLLFVAHGVSHDLWVDARMGTLRRMLASPRRVETFLAAKVASGTILMAVAVFPASVSLGYLADVPLRRLSVVMLWCLLSGSALLALFYAVQCLARSPRGGTVLSTLILLPILIAGSSVSALAVLPGWLGVIGPWTPNGLALMHLEQILAGHSSPADLLEGAAGLGLSAGVAFLIAARRLRSGLTGHGRSGA